MVEWLPPIYYCLLIYPAEQSPTPLSPFNISVSQFQKFILNLIPTKKKHSIFCPVLCAPPLSVSQVSTKQWLLDPPRLTDLACGGKKKNKS